MFCFFHFLFVNENKIITQLKQGVVSIYPKFVITIYQSMGYIKQKCEKGM